MSLKFFYAAIVSVLVTVMALAAAWEFLLEDWLLPSIVSHHEKESMAQRWEFFATTAFFSFIALLGPTVIGTKIIRRDRALQETMIRLSQEDDLTGLFNRRRIAELIEQEIKRASRYGTTFSVILMDIDHFKVVNDRFGHLAGDEVLVKIANIIRSKVRTTDVVGRWGGEEFLIILPETDIAGSCALAENIRTRLESADLGAIGHRTGSFGVTSYADGDDLEAIIARADVALYSAKWGGRNRIEKAPARATAVPDKS